jgi:hypothetical protein
LGGTRTHNQRLKRAHSIRCNYRFVRQLGKTLFSCSTFVALEELRHELAPEMRCLSLRPVILTLLCDGLVIALGRGDSMLAASSIVNFRFDLINREPDELMYFRVFTQIVDGLG